MDLTAASTAGTTAPHPSSDLAPRQVRVRWSSLRAASLRVRGSSRLNLDARQRWSGDGAPIRRCICVCICVKVRAWTAYVCRDPLAFGIVKTRPSPAVGARARPCARCSVGAGALAQAPATHAPRIQCLERVCLRICLALAFEAAFVAALGLAKP